MKVGCKFIIPINVKLQIPAFAFSVVRFHVVTASLSVSVLQTLPSHFELNLGEYLL